MLFKSAVTLASVLLEKHTAAPWKDVASRDCRQEDDFLVQCTKGFKCNVPF